MGSEGYMTILIPETGKRRQLVNYAPAIFEALPNIFELGCLLI